MKRLILLCSIFSCSVLLCGALTLLAPAFVSAQEIGKAAPDFMLTDSHGQKHSLLQYKNKYVVLEWINPECPFVKKHYNSGNMQGLQKKYTETGKDVIWLTITSSAEGKQGYLTPAAANAEVEKQKAVPTAFLLDYDGAVGKLYGAKTTPHMYVINPEGTLIYKGAIDSNSSADPEDIKTSVNYVSKALDEAMAGNPVEVSSTEAYGCSIKYKD